MRIRSALRDHVLHEDFVADLQALLADGAVPPERLELRIAEKVFVARDWSDLRSLRQRGVQFVVDEVGRGAGSLAALARAPICGLQLDRAWVQALCTDPVAHNVCRAGIAMATASAHPDRDRRRRRSWRRVVLGSAAASLGVYGGVSRDDAPGGRVRITLFAARRPRAAHLTPVIMNRVTKRGDERRPRRRLRGGMRSNAPIAFHENNDAQSPLR